MAVTRNGINSELITSVSMKYLNNSNQSTTQANEVKMKFFIHSQLEVLLLTALQW